MIDNTSQSGFQWLLHGTMFTVFLAAAMPAVETNAQTLGEDKTQTIVGSEVTEKSPDNIQTVDPVIAAIAEAGTAADQILLLVNVESFDIVFLGEPETIDNYDRIEAAMEEHEDGIAAMRQAMKGSAVFYNALDSHGVDTSKVVAAEITDDNAVTVYLLASK